MPDIENFLKTLHMAPEKITPLEGGRNNRAYRVDLSSHSVVLKHYFSHPQDSRDRLGNEYAFLSYAEACDLSCVPRPLGRCPEKKYGVYSYIPGRKAQLSDIHETNIKQTFDFFACLNHQKHRATLPLASEACLCMEDYFRMGERRLALLQTREIEEETVRSFITEELLPCWHMLCTRFPFSSAEREKLLTPQQLCITPSDFGFHNILFVKEQAHFIDFEYAGWDDPAKTICDFFCQPQFPIPETYFSAFCRLAAPGREERVRALYPLVQFKWACVFLNSFLNVYKTQRAFAQSGMTHGPSPLTASRAMLHAICINKQ